MFQLYVRGDAAWADDHVERAIKNNYAAFCFRQRPTKKEALESLIAYCREKDRICPLPPHWQRLWEMLPNRSRDGAGWRPPAPLILAAWHDTPAMLKMLRLKEHIEWAAQHGALEAVDRFLVSLQEEDWFHLGE
jgi:hypothetical protein